jgi:uncharacterized protein YggU (UPF0235/DUF167 family)
MYIKAKVKAHAKKEVFEENPNGSFSIEVKEKPENNSANERVIELVAENFNVRPSDVKIVNGHRKPSKLISINKK